MSGRTAVELNLGIAQRDEQGGGVGKNERAENDAGRGERRRRGHVAAFNRSLARCFTLSLRS